MEKEHALWLSASPNDPPTRFEFFDVPEPFNTGRWVLVVDVEIAHDAAPNSRWDNPADPTQWIRETPFDLGRARAETKSALAVEKDRALEQDGVAFTNAAGVKARYNLGYFHQQNINAVGVDIADPKFRGVKKRSLDQGRVTLTSQDCQDLARDARDRVITVLEWYADQEEAIDASSDPASLMPFKAPADPNA